MNELRKFIRIYNAFILPLIMLALSGLIIMAGVIPAYTKIMDTIEKNRVFSKDVDLLKTKVDFLKSLDPDTLRRQMDLLLTAVPVEKSVSTILIGLEQLAAGNGVTVNSFSIKAPGSLATGSAELVTNSSSLDNSIVSSDVTFAGSRDNTKAFFDTLVRTRRLMRASAVDMSFVEATDIIVVDMTVDSFFALLPETLGKATDTLKPLSMEDEALLARLEEYPLAIADGQGEAGTPVYFRVKTDPFSL